MINSTTVYRSVLFIGTATIQGDLAGDDEIKKTLIPLINRLSDEAEILPSLSVNVFRTLPNVDQTVYGEFIDKFADFGIILDETIKELPINGSQARILDYCSDRMLMHENDDDPFHILWYEKQLLRVVTYAELLTLAS
jgi:hypothetical protein